MGMPKAETCLFDTIHQRINHDLNKPNKPNKTEGDGKMNEVPIQAYRLRSKKPRGLNLTSRGKLDGANYF